MKIFPRKSVRFTPALAILLAAGIAQAQTCATPTSWFPWTTDGGIPASGTTCGQEDSVSLFCSSLDSAGKPDAVYSIFLAPLGDSTRLATAITISGGTAGFTPGAYIYSDACAQADTCVQNGDPSSPIPLQSIPGGTYFLTVSAASFDAAGACGSYALTTNGTFPVSLLEFSVE